MDSLVQREVRRQVGGSSKRSCLTRSNPISQGLMELHMVLPAPSTDEKNGLNLLRRLWVVKFDKEEEIRKLAER